VGGIDVSETITVEEAAKRLGIGRELAYRLAASGDLPGVRRLGARLIVSRVALDQYLAPKVEKPKRRSRAVPPPPPPAPRVIPATRADDV